MKMKKKLSKMIRKMRRDPNFKNLKIKILK
jgi:hypothetical protein